MKQASIIYYADTHTYRIFTDDELFSSPTTFAEAMEDYKRASAKVMLSSMGVVKCG